MASAPMADMASTQSANARFMVGFCLSYKFACLESIIGYILVEIKSESSVLRRNPLRVPLRVEKVHGGLVVP